LPATSTGDDQNNSASDQNRANGRVNRLAGRCCKTNRHSSRVDAVSFAAWDWYEEGSDSENEQNEAQNE
jgi:hypothetical protein